MLATCGESVAQSSVELGVFYADSADGPLANGWPRGGAIDLRLPLRASSSERLTIDVGWQFFKNDGQLRNEVDVHGLRALLSEHYSFLSWAEVQAGLGMQSFLKTPEPEYPLPLAPSQETNEEDLSVRGYGPLGTVGVGLAVLSTKVGEFQIQGSWTYSRVAGSGQSYYLIGVSLVTGRQD